MHIKIFGNENNNYEKFLLEIGMLKKLKNEILFPSLFYSSKKEIIIIESLLCFNLGKLFNFCYNKFPISTISCIGIESIKRLNLFHSLGIVYRDSRPNNLIWGNFSPNKNDFKDNIFLIDYDLAGFYKKDNGKHVE